MQILSRRLSSLSLEPTLTDEQEAPFTRACEQFAATDGWTKAVRVGVDGHEGHDYKIKLRNDTELTWQRQVHLYKTQRRPEFPPAVDARAEVWFRVPEHLPTSFRLPGFQTLRLQ